METFIVGGAVRDELLGLNPKDIDYVVVGATPADMIARGFEQVGADFPVFLHPETKDEYALARVERKTGVGYHGFTVSADTSVTLDDDLFRRDLTINAMAKGEDGTIHDPFNGQQDLKNGVLRHVGPAFADDPLRVIRLARFAARYTDFKIDPATFEMAREMVRGGELNHLPHERFWAELKKVLTDGSDVFWFFCVLKDLEAFTHVGFFSQLFGEAADAHLLYAVDIASRVIKLEDGEDKLMFFTALTAQAESKIIFSAPVRTQKLYGNMWKMRKLGREPEAVFEMLKTAKVWSQSSDFGDLIECLKFAEEMGEDFVVSAKRLRKIGEGTRIVTAADFPGVEGKALGEAIQKARFKIAKDIYETA